MRSYFGDTTLDHDRFFLALDASGRVGKDLETRCRNRFAATLADSVATSSNAHQGLLNLANLATKGRVQTRQDIVVFSFGCLLFEIRCQAARMTAIPTDASKPLAQFGMPLAQLLFDHGLSHLITSRIYKLTASFPVARFSSVETTGSLAMYDGTARTGQGE